MLSRLKGIETQVRDHCHPRKQTLDMLSRLKGIETRFTISSANLILTILWICFPVWRELKTPSGVLLISPPIRKLWICFPVWRELKHFIIKPLVYLCNGHFFLWICFPVWRELKPHQDDPEFFSGIPLDMLSRLKGNWNLDQVVNNLLLTSLDMLSRLKGIETETQHSWPSGQQSFFGYAFPFEGNWNFSVLFNNRLNGVTSLWICFPVWRELKQFFKKRKNAAQNTLDMLSRLKGIETYAPLPQGLLNSTLWICFPVWRELWNVLFESFKIANRVLWICFPVWRELKRCTPASEPRPHSPLWICFPVWRELKHHMDPNLSINSPPLDMLSRLKGIETEGVESAFVGYEDVFGYAFPFEGNWNCWMHWDSISSPPELWICFPVWRELKLWWQLPGWEQWKPTLWICFPVWRELKHCAAPASVANSAFAFGYAFPFEGNWNKISTNASGSARYFGYAFPFEGNWNFPLSGILGRPRCITLDMLSRLKGIETRRRFPGHHQLLFALDMLSRLKGIETPSSYSRCPSSIKALDMLSRLKGIETNKETHKWIILTFSLDMLFPFEGNWNNSYSLHRWANVLPLDMLSRLKGIETKIWALATSGS